MSQIYLIRHGETEWNRLQKTQGRSNNIPLSEVGRRQAELLAGRLKGEKIDLIYCSDLVRAHETAGIIAKAHGIEAVKDESFAEINFGCFEGLEFSKIKELYSEVFSVWRQTPHLANIPDGESIITLKERSMGQLNEILGKNRDKNILIVSHGITVKVMIASMLGIDLGNIHKIRQDNTSLNIFEYNENGFVANVINDTCHLRGEEAR
jgi:phosphoserine phosphatase